MAKCKCGQREVSEGETSPVVHDVMHTARICVQLKPWTPGPEPGVAMRRYSFSGVDMPPDRGPRVAPESSPEATLMEDE